MSVRSLEVFMQWSPSDKRFVGTLAHTAEGYRFEFSPAWIADDIDLSFRFTRRSGLLGPWPSLPGIFKSSLPDDWGRFVMDRRAREKGVRFTSDLDRLAYLGDRTSGALVYRPPLDDENSKTSAIELSQLAEQTELLLDGEIETLAETVAKAGSSMGGTRPKYNIGLKDERFYLGPLPDGAAAWLIKFPAKSDSKDIGKLESAYMQMAQAAGIDVPESRLFNNEVFGVRRFDRVSVNRRHMLNYADLFDMGNLIETYATSYEDLLRVTWRIAGRKAVTQMFRRMVFNILSHNRDDHVRNHAYLCDDRGVWSLSPAYDLTFSEGPQGLHSLVIGESAIPTLKEVHRLAEASSMGDINFIVEEIDAAVADWPKHARAVGLQKKRLNEISRRLKQVQKNFYGR